MIRSLLPWLMVMIFASTSAANDTSHFGIKFGVLRSRLDVITNSEPWAQIEHPRLGPVFGVYHKGSLANVPVDATLSYRQEGGVDRLYWTTPQHPNGSGEYSIMDCNYDLIDLSLTARPGFRVGDFGYSVVAGGGTSLVLGAHGISSEARSFNRFVFAYTYGIEIRYHRPANWMPFIEILSRTEFTNIYEHHTPLRESGYGTSVEHRVNSVSVLAGFALNK